MGGIESIGGDFTPNPPGENKKRLTEELEELREFKKNSISGEIKKKPLKIPRKAKVKGRKLKKGYVGIIKIDENGNMSGEKQKISGMAYKASDNLYHASDGREILFWEGKFPVMLQPSWRINPLKIDPTKEKNETYGDNYKMAKMLGDSIKVKAKKGGILIWLLIAGAGLFGINYLMGGSLFG